MSNFELKVLCCFKSCHNTLKLVFFKWTYIHNTYFIGVFKIFFDRHVLSALEGNYL